MKRLCIGKLWDANVTWWTDVPDVTPCMRELLLPVLPGLFLLLVALPYGLSLRRRANVNEGSSVLTKLKLSFSICLCVLHLAQLILSAFRFRLVDTLAPTIAPLVQSLTFAGVAVLQRCERSRGVISSEPLFLFWTLTVVCSAVSTYSFALNWPSNSVDVIAAWTFSSSCLVVVEFVLISFAESYDYTKYSEKPWPELQASVLSGLTFSWVSSLILTGYKRTLEESDMWSLHPRDMSHRVSAIFNRAWSAEMLRVRKRSPQVVPVDLTSETTPLLQTERPIDGNETAEGRKPSLFRVLVKCYLPTLLASHAFKLVLDILQFLGPIVQSALINFTENRSEENWKGYFLAVCLLFGNLIASVFFHKVFHISLMLGGRIKCALTAAIYQKALRLSNSARKQATSGEIVNLMSVDARRLQDVTGYLYAVWSSPFQIIVAFYMLWRTLGMACLAGIAVMIAIMPINVIAASILTKIETKQMKKKDERIKLMNEILNGIKVLKFYAWELSFQKKIEELRSAELRFLQTYSLLGETINACWSCAPMMVMAATLTTYTLSGNVLTAQEAFVTLSLFNILAFPLIMLPLIIPDIIIARVSMRRIEDFLRLPDLNEDQVQFNMSADWAVKIENGSFSWGKDEPEMLHNIDFEVKEGEFVAIVGKVGAGKSSLLSAILGEMDKRSGKVTLKSRTGYVSQQAWIQNATLRDNILFGSAMQWERYQKVLGACSLRPDLETLPAGELSEIGENGVNLSGGQKQRVGLARAVYNDADIIVLDDPLSAVDAQVGSHIFNNVFHSQHGQLRNKTRILVTHGIHWLPLVDKIVVLEEGRISEQGHYDDLIKQSGRFASFLQETREKESNSSGSDFDEKTEFPEPQKRSLRKRKSTSKSESSIKSVELMEPGIRSRLVEEEHVQVGSVKLSSLKTYFVAIGLAFLLIYTCFYAFYLGLQVFTNIWLSRWTSDPIATNISASGSQIYFQHRNYYLYVYIGMVPIQLVIFAISSLTYAFSRVRTARVLHNSMMCRVFRAPMSFFDTTAIGRVLNRFSWDVEAVDKVLPDVMREWFECFMVVVSTFAVITYSTPIFVTVIAPVSLMYFLIQRFYVRTSRQLKRIESITRSPIYANFSETIHGAATIRAYGHQSRFIDKSEKLVDHNQSFNFSSIVCNRWLGYRTEFVSCWLVFTAAILAVTGRERLSGAIVGLSIAYVFQITQALNWCVRMSSDIETNAVSVERIDEYIHIDTEALWQIEETAPSPEWPEAGTVRFENYSCRYRPGLDLVLRDLNFDIFAGEKIGIVGRTGAGKSSLTLALFRIVEADEGSILIDGTRIASLGLHQLRSRITILPQDPVMFSGSLRFNLDPFSSFTDAQLWIALQQAHLDNFIQSQPELLEYQVGEGGTNLSVGQRQLLCLARSLLRKTRLLVLDEATAAVDIETDQLIQATIREHFRSTTILTIAHRLNTIMDSDRILVLSEGKVVEFDTPAILLRKQNSVFRSLANESGLL